MDNVINATFGDISSNKELTVQPPAEIKLFDSGRPTATPGGIEIKIPLDELKKRRLFLATPMYGGQAGGMFTRSIADLAAACAPVIKAVSAVICGTVSPMFTALAVHGAWFAARAPALMRYAA